MMSESSKKSKDKKRSEKEKESVFESISLPSIDGEDEDNFKNRLNNLESSKSREADDKGSSIKESASSGSSEEESSSEDVSEEMESIIEKIEDNEDLKRDFFEDKEEKNEKELFSSVKMVPSSNIGREVSREELDILKKDSIIAEKEVKESIIDIKRNLFPEIVRKRGHDGVPSDLAYKAALEAIDKDLDPCRVLKVLMYYESVSEKALEKACDEDLDPVDVARVLKESDKTYKIFKKSKELNIKPVEVMKIKEMFPDNWEEIIEKSKEKNLDPLRVGMIKEKLPEVFEESLDVSSDKDLDSFSTALCLKFHRDISKEAIKKASRNKTDLYMTALTMDYFDEKIFRRALTEVWDSNLDLYWTAKCIEEYPLEKAIKLIDLAKERNANPYILSKMLV